MVSQTECLDLCLYLDACPLHDLCGVAVRLAGCSLCTVHGTLAATRSRT